MKLYNFIMAGLFAIPLSANAAKDQAVRLDHVYLSVGYDSVDVDSADFDGAFAAEGGVRWLLSETFLLETALSGINEAETQTVEDNTGSYQLTLNSWDLLLGGVYQFDFTNKLSGFLRFGLLAYSMEIELEEGFYDLKPSGKDSASDNGFGFYVGGGCGLAIGPNSTLDAQIIFKRRSDFLDDSSRPFDVDTTTFSIGTRYSF